MNTRLLAMLAALGLSAATSHADQVTHTIRTTLALRVGLTCTGDMEPRRKVLTTFLKRHGYTALDFTGYKGRGELFSSNGLVAGVDMQHQQVVSLISQTDPAGESFGLTLSKPVAESRETLSLPDAIMRLVHNKLHCEITSSESYSGTATLPADEDDSWIRYVRQSISNARAAGREKAR
jgi:hypothetical protein